MFARVLIKWKRVSFELRRLRIVCLFYSVSGSDDKCSITTEKISYDKCDALNRPGLIWKSEMKKEEVGTIYEH